LFKVKGKLDKRSALARKEENEMEFKDNLGSTKKSQNRGLLSIIGVIIVLVGVVLTQVRSQIYAAPDAQQISINEPGDLNTYMGSYSRINYNASETILNKNTISGLKVLWQYKAGGSIDTQPVIVNGVIYWGSWDGYEHATDLSGNQLWKSFLGTDTPPGSCIPASAGVASTATVGKVPINGTNTEVVFVGGGNDQFYALNASTGAVVWSTSLGTPPNEMIWAGSALYKGSIYVGISSFGDCPLEPGRVFRLNDTTGAVQNTFNTTANNCNGAGVWNAPSVDVANNTIYLSTGTRTTCKTYESMAYALLELSATDLTLVHSWQVPPAQQLYDSDFGDSPTLFTVTIGGIIHYMVGLLNKNGYYYAFDRANISTGPLWEKQMAGTHSNIAASAWNGTTLYVGTAASTINGQDCKGSVWALDPATGKTRWEYCAPGKVIAAPTVIPGLVIAGSGNHIVILDAATGQSRFDYDVAGPGATFFGSATVSNGVLYIGNENGSLFAFGL
jgi:outer membrane protein assembly factor BamB